MSDLTEDDIQVGNIVRMDPESEDGRAVAVQRDGELWMDMTFSVLEVRNGVLLQPLQDRPDRKGANWEKRGRRQTFRWQPSSLLLAPPPVTQEELDEVLASIKSAIK